MSDTTGVAGPSGMAVQYDDQGNVIGTMPVNETTRGDLASGTVLPDYNATGIPLPGERAEAARHGHEPAPPTHDVEWSPVSNTGPETLTAADRMWIQTLDPQNLTRDESSQLRAWRRTTTRRDEHRLLNSLLRVDDEKRETERESRRGLVADPAIELAAITAALRAGGGTGRAGAELIARGSVDAAIADAKREEIARFQSDPRRTEGKTEWNTEARMYVDVAKSEHGRRLKAIDDSRDRLMEATIAEIEEERRTRWNGKRDRLLARQRELHAQLNGNGS
jgi:hypothetical protein